jgi:galactokinase
MEILPEGEHFVGTRGGGMDHAASLASRAGSASLIHFEPVRVDHIPIPSDWTFLVAHSGHTAEKSGAVRERYNAVRTAGAEALRDFGFASYADAVARVDLSGVTQPVFLHVVSEARRVMECVDAMRSNDPDRFGRLLLDSHASLRDRLQVSTPTLDGIVETAMSAGALGARLTGAGFGGCAVVFCRKSAADAVTDALIDRCSPPLLFQAEAGTGALDRLIADSR